MEACECYAWRVVCAARRIVYGARRGVCAARRGASCVRHNVLRSLVEAHIFHHLSSRHCRLTRMRTGSRLLRGAPAMTASQQLGLRQTAPSRWEGKGVESPGSPGQTPPPLLFTALSFYRSGTAAEETASARSQGTLVALRASRGAWTARSSPRRLAIRRWVGSAAPRPRHQSTICVFRTPWQCDSSWQRDSSFSLLHPSSSATPALGAPVVCGRDCGREGKGEAH